MAGNKLAEAIQHHQAGRLDQAEAGYLSVLTSDPDNADAIHLLGVIAFQRGDLEEARERVSRALSINSSIAMYHANLGRIEKARGQLSAAISSCRQSLSIVPAQADVLSDLSGALVDMGDYDQALTVSKQALAIDPNFAPALINQGAAWFQKAKALHDAGDLTAAEDSYKFSIAANPDLAEAHCNLGNILRGDRRLNEALKHYDLALGIIPDQAEIHANKGVALQELNNLTEAIKSYRTATHLDPENAEAHRNLAMALLKRGEFEEGWKEFEWRWKTAHFASIRRDWNKPLWNGEPCTGKTILVHAEQGFGDTFQMARYLPELAGRGAKVIVEAPDTVGEVLQSAGGIERIIPPGTTLPDHDFHIPMMSLPGAFNTTFDNIPSPEGYLSAPDHAIECRKFKTPDTGKRKIGIVWKGNPTHPRDAARSPGLEAQRPLIENTDADFYSLQVGQGGEDIKAANLSTQITDLEPDLQTFSDTAAAIHHLDLVITPDTAVAHLAGAMGCPVWLMLEFASEWRWFEGREECSWYGMVRVFRQEKIGDWGSVLELISTALTIENILRRNPIGPGK